MFQVFSNIPYGVAPAVCHLWFKRHKLKSCSILTGNNGKLIKITPRVIYTHIIQISNQKSYILSTFIVVQYRIHR